MRSWPALTKYLKYILESGKLEERLVSSILEHTTATRLSSELSSIQSSIARLRLNVFSVMDVDTQKKIELLQGYSVDACVYAVGLQG
ncbi:MAG: hypothetical protein ACOCWZ_09880 [Spirochaetota bacterium]